MLFRHGRLRKVLVVVILDFVHVAINVLVSLVLLVHLCTSVIGRNRDHPEEVRPPISPSAPQSRSIPAWDFPVEVPLGTSIHRNIVRRQQ